MPPVTVSFAQQICEEPVEEPAFELELPLDDEPQGIACSQLPVGTLTWSGKCGGLHLPCADEDGNCSADASSEPSCDSGLTCDDGGGGGGLCLAPCETDDDCPLPDVEVCDDGLCRVPDRL